MPLWYLNWRSPLLILQSMLGVAVFSYAFRRKKGFVWRLPVSLLIGTLLSYCAQHLIFIPGVTMTAILSHAVVSLINYLLVMVIVANCLDESKWTVLFLTTMGCIAQSMAGCVKTLVRLIPPMNALALHRVGVLLLDVLCYGGVCALLFFAFRPFTQEREDGEQEKSKVIFSTTALIVYLAMSWLIQDFDLENATFVFVSNFYAIAVQTLIYIVQFGVMDRARLSHYIETMRELVHQQHAQYETSRESVQLINEKYHDLKNLLGSIQGLLPQEEIDRLKSSIARYDVRVQTGFDVLDVVLTEKMDLCLQRGITLTCNLGRANFGFMEELDLYTLFNNALTNAINAVSEQPEGVARFIILTANQENNMISIHMENPCAGDIRFVDGLPQTSDDPNWHGFGMKSMAHTAEKYGGAISVSQENGSFQLDILLLELKK